jgi:hypothetical protein
MLLILGLRYRLASQREEKQSKASGEQFQVFGTRTLREYPEL